MIRRFMLAAAALAAATISTATAGVDGLTFTIGGRVFERPADMPIIVDGQPATLADMLRRPDGQQARWVEVAPGRGEPPTLVFAYTLIGPVTSIEPLAVLGQPVTVTADTVLSGLDDVADLELGAPLVVAGLVDPNGSLFATLIEQRGAPGNRFLLSGYVSTVGTPATDFTIGDQPVSAPGVTFVDCPGGAPAIGQYLELRATAVTPFPPGTTLATVTDARCLAPTPPGVPGAEGFLQAIISAVPSDTTFAFGPLEIAFDANTTFAFGDADDLAEGIAVAVEGAYVDATHFLAEGIEFVRPQLRFELPMGPADAVAGETISPFGVPVRWSAQLRDEDGYFANGLATTRQVEVRGYLDAEGNAYATRVRDRGAADPADIQLRAPVDAIAAPTLTIQGVTVDTTGATFFDADENPTTAELFFATVAIGDEVDSTGGSYDATTRTLTGGAITLVAPEPVLPPPQTSPVDAVRAGTATYALPEVVFRSGFE